MISLLSCSLPLSPRETNIRQTFSRRSRRAEKVRNGATLERVLRTAHWPVLPRDAAALAACSRCAGARPARSASSGSRTIWVPSSASRFCENFVESVDSSWFISASFFFAGSSSFAPWRTKPLQSIHSSRCCSGESFSFSRCA